eukprot:ctg_2375.g573
MIEESPQICRFMNEHHSDHLLMYLRRFGPPERYDNLPELERIEMTQVDRDGFEVDLVLCSDADNNCVCLHERLEWQEGRKCESGEQCIHCCRTCRAVRTGRGYLRRAAGAGPAEGGGRCANGVMGGKPARNGGGPPGLNAVRQRGRSSHGLLNTSSSVVSRTRDDSIRHGVADLTVFHRRFLGVTLETLASHPARGAAGRAP